jgi:hypothetical protein
LVDAAAAAADIFVTPPPPTKITRRAAAAPKGAAPRSIKTIAAASLVLSYGIPADVGSNFRQLCGEILHHAVEVGSPTELSHRFVALVMRCGN